MIENNREHDWIRKSRRANAARRYYKGIAMRSGWEVTFAAWLDSQGLSWRYEPRLFDLGAFSYLPDFWVEEWSTYVEIKPRWRMEEGRKKIEAFRTAGYPLRVVTDHHITALN